MYLGITVNPGTAEPTAERTGYFSGRMWRFDEQIEQSAVQPVGGDDTLFRSYLRELVLPFGVTTVDRRPSVCQYGNRLYAVGGHSANLLVDEHERVLTQGIMAPTSAPIITGAAGTGTLAYLSFWDELTDEYSPLSNYTEIGDGTPRTWNSLPTYVPDYLMFASGSATYSGPKLVLEASGKIFASDSDGLSPLPTQKLSGMRPGDKIYSDTTVVGLLKAPISPGVWYGKVFTPGTPTDSWGRPTQRASHVVLWLSVAGGLPRQVTKVRLGATSVTESVEFTALGEIHPGDYGRFPLCTINTIYRDRQLMAGDKSALDTVYLSAVGFPERYEGFKFTTREGEAVTALIGTRDYCLVMTANSTYILQGYTEEDMTFNLLDNGVGAVSHHTNVIVNGFPCVTTRNGWSLFNGAWHPMMDESASTFSAHLSESKSYPNYTVTNAAFYQSGWVMNNPLDKTIQLFLGPGSSRGELTVQEGAPVEPTSATEGWFHPLHDQIPFADQTGTYSWVLNYEPVVPQAGGAMGQGKLTMDALGVEPEVVGQRYTTSAYLYGDDGGVAAVWFGDNNGTLWKEDSGVAFAGAGAILTPAYFFGEGGGYEREGKTLVKFWSYVEANEAWKVAAIGGDEWAGLAGACWSSFLPWAGGLLASGQTTALSAATARQPLYYPPHPKAVALKLWPYRLATGAIDGADVQFSATITDPGDSGHLPGPPFLPVSTLDAYSYWVPKTVWEHSIPGVVSGRTISFLYVFPSSIGAIWRGVGGYYGHGPATQLRLYTWNYSVIVDALADVLVPTVEVLNE